MKIVYVVFSNLAYDQRVRQELKTLSKRYDVYSISIGKNSKGKNIEISTANLPFIRFFIAWIKFFFEFRRLNPNLIIFADINTAPAALFYKMLYNIPIVFDMHEIGSEMKEKHNYFVKFLWKTLEYFTLKNADSIITVNRSIAMYVRKKVRKVPMVLFNYPSKDMWYVLSKGDGKSVCYVGNLMEDRGLEQLVRAFKELRGYNLVIIGGGKLENRLKQLASGTKNIIFRGVVAMEKLPEEMAKCGIGVVLNEGKSRNNMLGLPNKIFQYIRMGMPFICSDLPEMKKITNITRAGIACPPDVESIKREVIKLSQNYSEFKKNVMKCRERFVWEKQEADLIKLVKRYE